MSKVLDRVWAGLGKGSGKGLGSVWARIEANVHGRIWVIIQVMVWVRIGKVWGRAGQGLCDSFGRGLDNSWIGLILANSW